MYGLGGPFFSTSYFCSCRQQGAVAFLPGLTFRPPPPPSTSLLPLLQSAVLHALKETCMNEKNGSTLVLACLLADLARLG